MDIRAEDVYRSILNQLKADISEAEPSARSKALVELVEFVMSNAIADGARTIGELLEREKIAPWDETWVLQEMARATLETLSAGQIVASALFQRLRNSDDSDTTRELCESLAEVYRLAAER